MSTRMICETCGGELDISADKLQGKCPFCRNTYYFKEEKGEALILALNRARGHRLACDFHEAIKEYKLVLDEYPKDAEAHFGMLLSTYGIEFVEDRRTGKYIPTCHRFVEKEVLTNENYISAIANASDEQKESYTSEAQRISVLQKGIKAKLDSEEPYDVFISFKSTDSEGRATEDSVIARNIYDSLTKNGIKTFFSEVTLRNRVGDEYEPIIYRALYSCKFFILVATSEEYVNAPWVKNEWSRFEDRIAEEGLSGACTAVFRGINPYNLPRAFQNQGIDIEKHPFDYAILLSDSLENKLRPKSKDSEIDELRRKYAELEKQVNSAKNPVDTVPQPEQDIITAPSNSEPVAEVSEAVPAVPKRAASDQYASKSQQPVKDKPIAKQPTANDGFYKLCDVKDGVILKCNDKKIKEISIPNGITGIGDHAFDKCSSLVSIDIPDGVTNIGDAAFGNCISLEKVSIPETVRSVGNLAFDGCKSIAHITLPIRLKNILNELPAAYLTHRLSERINIKYTYNGADQICVFEDDVLVECIDKTVKEVIIPEGITGIGSNAFKECAALKRIVLPDSVKRIGKGAFISCGNLFSVTLGKGVEKIEDDAFRYCSMLVEVINHSKLNIVAEKEKYGYVGYYAKEIHTQKSKIESIGDYIFYSAPNGENYLLNYTGSGTKLELPESYRGMPYEIYNYAFFGRADITDVSIPVEVTGIGESAFGLCENLTSVKLSAGVTSIGSSAFSFCKSLTGISIPAAVTSIGYDAFSHCKGLTSVSVSAWITEIAGGTFRGCEKLVNIKLPNGVTEIGDNAFCECKSLNEITIPDCVEYIGSHAFSGCAELKSVNLSNSLTSIGLNAFEGCTSLTNISIPENVTYIGGKAFFECTRLESVNIPNGVKEISNSLFSGCKSLKAITIPKGVTKINECAFENCENLASAILSDGLLTIGWGAFYGCKNLTAITVPASVSSIHEEAFTGCTGLKSITISKSFKSDIKKVFPWYIFKLFGGVKVKYT